MVRFWIPPANQYLGLQMWQVKFWNLWLQNIIPGAQPEPFPDFAELEIFCSAQSSSPGTSWLSCPSLRWGPRPWPPTCASGPMTPLWHCSAGHWQLSRLPRSPVNKHHCWSQGWYAELMLVATLQRSRVEFCSTLVRVTNPQYLYLWHPTPNLVLPYNLQCVKL